MVGYRRCALLVLVVAATAAPAQVLAAAAVGAALAGQPVGWWCVGLAVATVLRAIGGYLTTITGVGCANRIDAALHRRFAAGLIAAAPHQHGDLAAAVAGRMQAVRSFSEIAGLALGAGLVLGCLDLRLLAPWLGAVVVVAIRCRRDRRVLDAARIARRAADAEQRRQALIAAAPLIGDLDLVTTAVAREDHAAASLHQAQAAGRRPATVILMIAGIAQTLVSVQAVQLASAGTISIGGAIAAILVTTTAAARCELLAGAIHGQATWILCMRRLARLPPAVASSHAVVGTQDRLFAGSLRRNLDPSERLSTSDLHDALTRAGFAEARDRLDQTLGAGGTGVSAGETVRLALARAMLAAPQTIALADPHRHLDRATAERIRPPVAA